MQEWDRVSWLFRDISNLNITGNLWLISTVYAPKKPKVAYNDLFYCQNACHSRAARSESKQFRTLLSLIQPATPWVKWSWAHAQVQSCAGFIRIEVRKGKWLLEAPFEYAWRPLEMPLVPQRRLLCADSRSVVACLWVNEWIGSRGVFLESRAY